MVYVYSQFPITSTVQEYCTVYLTRIHMEYGVSLRHFELRCSYLCRVVRETGTVVPNVRVLEPCSIIQSFNSGDDGALSTTGRWTSVSTSSTQCSPCDAENTAWIQEVLKRELDSKVMRLTLLLTVAMAIPESTSQLPEKLHYERFTWRRVN